MELAQASWVKTSADKLNKPFGKILVRLDCSLGSRDALDVARELALQWKAKLYVVGCDPLPDAPSDEAFHDAVRTALRHYEEFFYRIRLAGMNEGLQVETFICLGTLAGCLFCKAQQLKARLLVIGCPEDLDIRGNALQCEPRLAVLCNSEASRRF
jgi:hypothetical protein